MHQMSQIIVNLSGLYKFEFSHVPDVSRKVIVRLFHRGSERLTILLALPILFSVLLSPEMRMHESLFLPIPLHVDPIIRICFPVNILVTTSAVCSYMLLIHTHDLCFIYTVCLL
ncbi:hypothetical protein BC827DRAFT_577783 [Russula dissimulans]|nr:hypothetical protein BC827DRAFT_577783 [Russula dissimulans]